MESWRLIEYGIMSSRIRGSRSRMLAYDDELRGVLLDAIRANKNNMTGNKLSFPDG